MIKYSLLGIIWIYASLGISAVKYDMKLDDNTQATQNTNIHTTEAEAKAELLDILGRSKSLKGSWQDVEIEPIISKDFEETTEEGTTTVTKYYKPENFSLTLKDMTAENNAAALDAAIERKLKCGADSIKYIAKRNVAKGLTTEQIKTMASTYGLINSLLSSGAIDTAIEEIGAMTPDGIIVTPQDKTEILNFINTCNN
jgi:uncharacterized protein YjgD (DUF1641 family)